MMSCSRATGSPMRTTSPGCARSYAATKPRRSARLISAVPTRRMRSRIGWRLEEVRLGIRPELTHVLDRLDHGVLEAAVFALDATDVDVVHGLPVLVEPDRTTRRVGNRHAAQGLEERVGVFHLATDPVERLLQEQSSRVGADRVIAGVRPERLPVRGHELAIGCLVERGAVI